MSFISPVATDASGAPKQTGSMQSLGKDDFLQLLVTKLQYQDPLSPMADEDFIAQLAQFSSLEQMNNIAEGISTSNQWDFLQMQSINNTMASGLIGKDVKASYKGIYLDTDNKPEIAFTIGQDAASVQLIVRDSTGVTIATITKDNVKAGVNTVKWDGKDSLGNRAPEGYYTVEAVATNSEGESFTPSLSLVGTVTSIVYREGVAYLKVNGMEIPMGDILAIGEPGAFDKDEG
ncbi:MAG: flagellar hook capping FlgD N-terminal domain-containing protein [candidate division Zixibacteria bacterium]|nr:flagellar hook capping FlgD N-terminal domain-containing protein [candidate division Zixibacteria bacterium]MDD5425274.1 flagellar hook capping FlgD N-terminal domain-containing protein [candidate division Zixibacteria bacterium]